MDPHTYDIFDRLNSSLNIHAQDLAHLRILARVLMLQAPPPTPTLAADLSGRTAPSEGAMLNVHQAAWLRPMLEGPHDHGYLDGRWAVAVRQASTGLDLAWLQGIRAATVAAALHALAGCGNPDRAPCLLRSLNKLHDLDALIIRFAYRELRAHPGPGRRQLGHTRPVHTQMVLQ